VINGLCWGIKNWGVGFTPGKGARSDSGEKNTGRKREWTNYRSVLGLCPIGKKRRQKKKGRGSGKTTRIRQGG